MLSPANRESLFRSWLAEHPGIVAKVARSFAPAPTDYDDLTQEMLLQLWLSLPSFAGGAKPSTWIYRVCLNTALTWRRKSARDEQRRDDTINLAEVAAAATGPAESTADREMLDRLYDAIRQLPNFDRALVLLMLDDLSYREIADVTGLTENHVGVALTRARKRLSALMKGVVDELE